MKTKAVFWCGLGMVAVGASASAVGVGDTYASVIAEKGAPGREFEAPEGRVLQYPTETIRVREGRVSAVAAVVSRPQPELPAHRVVASVGKSAGDADRPTWTTDYQAALARAKAEGRHVFLFFTGSDWCGWCMRLQKEILTTPEFARYAHEKLVLVELDFPSRKKLPAAVKQQNQELARRFGIRGYPTVVILNGSGKQVGQLGYQPGGPGPFVAQLKRL